ncbi:MAG: DinB family protein [Gemmatimonadota bacterium]
MMNIDEMITPARRAVEDLLVAAEKAEQQWATPRAPGKWSPSQIVEHVARSFDESANEIAGVPSKFPSFPAFVRPLVRALFFNRVLRNQAFPRARTTKAMNPASGPATPSAGRGRLEAAFGRFEQECRTRAAHDATFTSVLFGTVSLQDYVSFQELHTHHHRKQITGER